MIPKIHYGLFFDNHTQRENPDVGRDFDAEYFTDQLKRCGVDYLGFHARCNVGFAYYDTTIGTKHPSLRRDLFGELADACAKKDISLVAYLNGGISTQEALDHPEWQTRYLPGTDFYGKNTPFAITMCYHSGYRKHLIAMIREIATKYPVKGFFIDCLSDYPCVCPHCVDQMKAEGIDYTDEKAVRAFQRKSVVGLCDEISSAVREIIPEPLLYFNGPVFDSVKNADSFFDCECLPTCAVWGYECLPTMAHYMRCVKPGTQLLNMTGRFYEWGDFGGLRNRHSLEFDLFYGLANGLRPNIAGHFHPRGDRDQAVFDRIAEVYAECQKYHEAFWKAEVLAEVAVVYPEDNHEKRWNNAVTACVRMLDELHVQFDIVLANNTAIDWNKRYRLLILPEEVEITPDLEQRVRQFVADGGAFFACGKAASEHFGDLLGVESEGDSGLDPVYFQMHGDFAEEIEPMFLSLYAKAAKARLTDGVGASHLVRPYYNTGWNGYSAITYTPPQVETEMPFLVRKGTCVWCAGDLFSGYYLRGALHLRQLLQNVLKELLPKPLLRAFQNIPSFGRVFLSRKPGKLILTLLSYAPEQRGKTVVVEDPIPVLDATLEVRTDGKTPSSVKLLPDNTPIAFHTDGEYTAIPIPAFRGHAVFEIDN